MPGSKRSGSAKSSLIVVARRAGGGKLAHVPVNEYVTHPPARYARSVLSRASSRKDLKYRPTVVGGIPSLKPNMKIDQILTSRLLQV